MSFTVTDLPDKQQLAIWKKMSYSEKYELLMSMIRQGRELKRIGLKLKFPQDSETEIDKKLAHICLHART